jgi:uncharacterized membrane protein YdjX (TVP38/TMEM64 family)
VKKNAFKRLAIIFVFILLAACLVYIAFQAVIPGLIPLLENGNIDQIRGYLQSIDKPTGLLLTALLQIIQVMSVILPGTPIQIAAGIVYGVWRSFLVCHLSYVAGNMLVFFTARRLGARINRLLPVEAASTRLAFIYKSANPAYMVALGYLSPIFPSGLIPYVAAKTIIKPGHFALAAYGGSFFPILIFCAAGSKILEGNYLTSVLLVAALMIVSFLLARYKDKVMGMIRTLLERRRKHRNQGHP